MVRLGNWQVAAVLFVMFVFGASGFFLSTASQYGLSPDGASRLLEFKAMKDLIYTEVESSTTSGQQQVGQIKNISLFEIPFLIAGGALQLIQSLFSIPELVASILSVAVEVFHIPGYILGAASLIVSAIVLFSIAEVYIKWPIKPTGGRKY